MNINDFSMQSLNQIPGKINKYVVPATGELNGKYAAITFLEDSTLTALEEQEIDLGIPIGQTMPKGITMEGIFTTVHLASGAAILTPYLTSEL